MFLSCHYNLKQSVCMTNNTLHSTAEHPQIKMNPYQSNTKPSSVTIRRWIYCPPGVIEITCSTSELLLECTGNYPKSKQEEPLQPFLTVELPLIFSSSSQYWQTSRRLQWELLINLSPPIFQFHCSHIIPFCSWITHTEMLGWLTVRFADMIPNWGAGGKVLANMKIMMPLQN